jgi:hypothetical protein
MNVNKSGENVSKVNLKKLTFVSENSYLHQYGVRTGKTTCHEKNGE